ncbi:MAG: hypothetical protein HY272_06085 [Gammaproteobacteria bacterium]|nr:hypothetical protein [Gammaproteobacteria bacterium]
MKIKNYLGWVAAAAVLAACNGVTEPELPAERPFGSVSGYVVDDPVSGATVSVYAFDDGRQGELLATSSVSAADGAYALRLQSKDRPVLIEARGGAFTDLVSGAHIDVDSDQVLRAVTLYRSGEPLSLMVTPLTHIAAGLAEYKAAHGVAVGDAVTKSNAEISKLFQVDIINTHPFSISDTSAVDRDGQYYGFYLAAMSSWADWATKRGNAAPGAVFSTMELTQIIYNDIQADGVLDGVGLNSVNGQPMALEFAGQPLNPSVYRLDLAQHMVTLAAGDKNATGIVMNDLLPRAKALLENSDGLVPSGVPAIDGKVTLTSFVRENWYYNGELPFSVMPSETIVLKQVRFDVDGTVIGDAADPNQPAIKIVTTSFVDGDHKVRAVATDMLGNKIEKTFLLKFDNEGPNLNPDPVAVTNLSSITLTGGYIENGAALSSIKIGNQFVTPDITKKTWRVDNIPLTKGKNSITTVVTDVIGNQVTSKIDVLVDQAVPEILATVLGHGEARFLDGNGVVTSKLLTDASVESVYFETDKVGLRGTLIARANLKASLIPYFAFKVNDPASFDVAGSVPDKISVSLQIEKDGVVMSPWVPLAMVNGEYLLPLATEKLYANWLKLTPNDVISLRVRAFDEAGNPSKEKLFTFKPNFVVPAFAQGAVMSSDKGSALFLGTAFTNRGGLHGVTFKDAEYSFTNMTGRPYYIRVQDVGQHMAERFIEQRIREHEVIRTTSTEWRGTFADLATLTVDGCPQVGNAQSIASVYNYTVTGWQLEHPPTLPVVSGSYRVYQDVPSAAGSWTSLPDFDSSFYPMPNGAWVDYSLNDPVQADPAQVAMVSNWGGVCANVSSLEQRETYSYVSTLGPVNTLTPSFLKESKGFFPGTFKVFNKTTNSEITPVNDRYLVPAGAQVTVERWLVTPSLGIDDDTDVADPTAFASYAMHSFDQKIDWAVQNKILIEAVHDTGDTANIDLMTVRKNNLLTADKLYQVSRPAQAN